MQAEPVSRARRARVLAAQAGQAASLAKEFDAGGLIQNIWAEVEEKFA